jgi:hypothetical protein
MEDQGPVQAGQEQERAEGGAAVAGEAKLTRPTKVSRTAKPAPPAVAQASIQAPGGNGGGQGERAPGRRRAMFKEFVFKPRTAHAVLKRKLELKSHSGQKVYEGCWHSIQDTFFYMDVILGWQGDLGDESLGALFEVLEKRFEEIEKDLDNETRRLRHIFESIGGHADVDYESVLSTELSVYSPSAGRYAEMIVRMDEMISWIDRLWFTGRVTPRERIATCRAWTVRLRRFNREAYQTRVRAMACVGRESGRAYGRGGDDMERKKARQRALAAAAAGLREKPKAAKSAKSPITPTPAAA